LLFFGNSSVLQRVIKQIRNFKATKITHTEEITITKLEPIENTCEISYRAGGQKQQYSEWTNAISTELCNNKRS
jgi:hypothetical protein